MPKTQIATANIQDGEVKRDDLNTETSGKAVVRKIVTGDNIKLGSTGADIGTGDVTINAFPLNVTFVGGNERWSGMPEALTEFLGSPYYFRTKVNLTHCLYARIVVRVTTAGAETSKIRLQYSTDESTWYYLDNLNGPTVAIDATGTIVSNYVTMHTNAKADVFLRLIGLDGDGGSTPYFGMIVAQFK